MSLMTRVLSLQNSHVLQLPFLSRILKVSAVFYCSKVEDETLTKRAQDEAANKKTEEKKVKVKVVYKEDKRQEAVVTSILTKEYEKMGQPLKFPRSINATYLFSDKLPGDKPPGDKPPGDKPPGYCEEFDKEEEAKRKEIAKKVEEARKCEEAKKAEEARKCEEAKRARETNGSETKEVKKEEVSEKVGEPEKISDVETKEKEVSSKTETSKHDKSVKEPVKDEKSATVSTASVGSGGGPIRPVRGEPGKVYFGFLSEDWVLFFVPKTGVSGIFTLFFTLGTYLVSKEIFVLEHNYYNGLSMALMCYLGVKYLGKPIAAYLDSEIDAVEKSWNSNRSAIKKDLTKRINHEQYLQWSAEGQVELVKAKRNNVELQLEAAYRQRQKDVYKMVKKLLDYQVEVMKINKKYAHRNLIEWVTKEVEKSLTKELRTKYFQITFDEVSKLINKISEKES